MTADSRSVPDHASASSRRGSHREYSRWRARQIAYGRWQPWADAAPVREHVRALRRQGASYRAIAEAAGVAPMTVHHLLNGCARSSRQLPHRIGASQAGRLLSVTGPAAATGRRDACGARRRARALVALGHCPAALARHAGVTAPRMARLLDGRTGHISAEFDAAVCRLYDDLWNQLPAERTRQERAIAASARHRAEAADWPPPMGLDDHRIDDPAYRPRIAWRRAVGMAPGAQIPAPDLCVTGPGHQVAHRSAAIRPARPRVCEAARQHPAASYRQVMRDELP